MSVEAILEAKGYKRFSTEDGKVYYYSTLTQQSVWELPQDIQSQIDKLNKTPTSKDAEVEVEVDIDVNKYRIRSSLRTVSHDNETDFVNLLRDNEVDATWSFNDIIDKLIQDPRYWSIKDALHKKQLFEKYLTNRSKEELLKENASIEKFKAAFVKIFQNYNIKYFSRWSTVKKLIQNESIYRHSVISEKIKRQTFQEYVDSLKEAHFREDNALRQIALEELTEYFKTLNITLESTWDDVLTKIKSDKRFEQNKHFNLLTQLDILKEYEVSIQALRQIQEDKLKQLLDQNYRKDRIARDEYKNLLQELREGGLLRANTTWEDLYPLIKEDDRFVGLLGRNGSNPIELFWDAIDHEELLIKAKKDIVEQLLLHNGFTLQLDDCLDTEKQISQIKEILGKDEQTKDYEDDEIELIHERLVKEAIEERERQRIARERQLKIAQEDFRSFLHRFNTPLIAIDTKWEDLKQLIEGYPEYQALPNEEHRVELFDKYIQRLKDRKVEIDARKEQELQKMINEANNSTITRKRPLIEETKAPVDELDY